MRKNHFAFITALFIYSITDAQVSLSPTEFSGFNYVEHVSKGWEPASPQNDKYEIKISNGDRLGDDPVNYIKSKEDIIEGSGAMYRCLALEPYRGKRVRMNVWAKTNAVTKEEGARFWFLGKWDGENIFDEAVINGTTDWKKYSIVLDISQYAYMTTYGVVLEGNGQIWFKNISFEIVDNTVPVTSIAKKKK
ncbi:hypothetical protein BH11BAC1_BH11BAC1_28430 [soil metagenome]